MAEKKEQKKSGGQSKAKSKKEQPEAEKPAPKKSKTSMPAAPELPEEKKEPEKKDLSGQMYSVLLFAAGILSLLLIFVQGSAMWKVLHEAIKGLFGIPVVLIPAGFFWSAYQIDQKKERQKLRKYLKWFGISIAFFCCFIEIMFGRGRILNYDFLGCFAMLRSEGIAWQGGGMLGALSYPILKFFGDVGAKILVCLMLFVSIMFLTKKSLSELFDLLKSPFRGMASLIREEREETRLLREYDYDSMDELEYVEPDRSLLYEQEALAIAAQAAQRPAALPDMTSIDIPMQEIQEFSEKQNKVRIRRKSGRKPEQEGQLPLYPSSEAVPELYQIPPVTLLDESQSHGNDLVLQQEQENTAERLYDIFKSFGVDVNITHIARGPSVTRYEIQPAKGVKVSRITNLADDIALNLAASGVRIETPIPGKPAIGIEVPNAQKDLVSLRELLESPEFQQTESKLAFGVGKDIAGNVIIGDVARMPHMIIAGATGSGKSVCTNSIIMSILYHTSPEDVRLILIDPKIVEFRVYNGIPHLLIPVVTDPKKATGALCWAVQEMMHRYDIFAEQAVRNLEEYQLLCTPESGLKKLPQILICIDELADLMMTASKEVEEAICRLAQLARAAGIYLIIATQRPTVDIITGLIKANIPSRIALSVMSQIDSRIILDCGGAEKLLGQGDMLYLPSGQPKPIRVQGCYISTQEIERTVSFIKKQTAKTAYDKKIIQAVEEMAVTDEKKSKNPEADAGQTDEQLLEQAIEIVVSAGQASTSNLQRRLRIGHIKAARIIDKMEEMGVISPYEGTKPRSVLITPAELEEYRKNRKGA